MNASLENISSLIRCENTSAKDFNELCQQQTKKRYPHHELYGQYCSLQDYVACPPDELFDYLKQVESLLEWTYSLRNIAITDEPGLFMFGDKVGGPTQCYCRVESNKDALTVDYHCAWDQPDELWMIYYMRIISAEAVLNKPGSIVLWTNCAHPYYANNPYPELVPEQRQIWVGDGWPFFKAGHDLELENLKHIAEYRHANGVSVSDLSHLTV